MFELSFFVLVVVVGDREVEWEGVVFFSHPDVKFEGGSEGGDEVRSSIEESEMGVPSLSPGPLSSFFASFTSKSDKVACGFRPGWVGEIILSAESLLKEVYVQDEGGFGFVINRVYLFEGEGICIAENDT